MPDNVLIPRNTWGDFDAYDEKADMLARMFISNFERYSDGVSKTVNAASPNPLS